MYIREKVAVVLCFIPDLIINITIGIIKSIKETFHAADIQFWHKYR